MPHAVSLGLGIAFVVLAVAAVVLQAWLWNPKYWDAAAKKSNAPKAWMRVHRVVGYAYALIYVVMMWHMVPRLWGYAIELPARTVVHAVAAIVIGVVLLTKIAILRWFRHFEEAMPVLGLVLLVCTVVLATLSIPLGLRAYADVDLDEEEHARLERVLSSIGADPAIDVHALSARESLVRGRAVLTTHCAQCHDLRTILAEPRTGSAWRAVVVRMAAKPTLGLTIGDADGWAVTAYLVSITPTLQQASAARFDELERARAATEPGVPEPEPDIEAADASGGDTGIASSDAGVSVDSAAPDAAVRARRPRRARTDSAGADAGAAEPLPTSRDAGVAAAPVAPPPEPRLVYSSALGRQLLTSRCEDCHGDEELDTHGGDDRAGWARVLRRMVERGASLDADESRVLATYLAATRPLP